MKLYVARHGQTDWNLENRMQGQTDVPLNETGINQAKKLKRKLESYDFDICYCSPMKRAVQTADIAVDGRAPILYDDNLKERSYGDYEGVDCATWNIDENDRRLNTNEGGMEPIKTVLARSKKVLERIKKENPDDAKVLVVAHGALLQALHFTIVGYDDDTDFDSFELENAALAEYEI
ncbi:histidine phosphatase family protein [Candidatus Saccharibacteria bacterium]|nr:histidine phosphatase family protein [Candidatus Saccharibacteria bacterium]